MIIFLKESSILFDEAHSCWGDYLMQFLLYGLLLFLFLSNDCETSWREETICRFF